MLPPRDMYTVSLLHTPVMARLNTIPAQMGVLYVMDRLAKASYPQLRAPLRWPLAIVWHGMIVMADVLHTAGHIVTARAAGVPMDAVVWQFGVLGNVYYQRDATPQQHMGRAVGGPLASGGMAAVSYAAWRLLRRVPLVGGLLEAWFVANLAVLGLALIPTPFCDGGTLLREFIHTRTGEVALGEEAVQQAGFGVVVGLLLTAPILLLRGKLLLALGAVALAGFIALDLLVFRGKMP